MLSLVYYSNVLFSHEESTTPLTEESTTPLKESNSLKKGVTPRYVSNYESNYESNVVVHHSTPSTSAMTATQTTKSAQHGAQMLAFHRLNLCANAGRSKDLLLPIAGCCLGRCDRR